MIVVHTDLYDPDGTLEIDGTIDSSNWLDGRRRITITPTLDGGVSVSDLGYFDAGREMAIAINAPTDAQVATALNMIRNHTRLVLVTKDGVFRCIPVGHAYAGGGLTLNMTVETRLSA